MRRVSYVIQILCWGSLALLPWAILFKEWEWYWWLPAGAFWLVLGVLSGIWGSAVATRQR